MAARTTDRCFFDRMGDPAFARGPLDVAFKLEENTWNGRSRLQAKLVDLRPSTAS